MDGVRRGRAVELARVRTPARRAGGVKVPPGIADLTGKTGAKDFIVAGGAQDSGSEKRRINWISIQLTKKGGEFAPFPFVLVAEQRDQDYDRDWHAEHQQ